MATWIEIIITFLFLFDSCMKVNGCSTCCKLKYNGVLDCTYSTWEKVVHNLSTYEYPMNITEIDISFVTLKVLPDKCFIHFKNLKKLTLIGNDIETLTNSSFKGLKRLETLIINENNFERIPGHVFNDIPNLKYLNLNRNIIEKLCKGDFAKFKRLRKLYLRGNVISEVDDLTFSELSDTLRALDLQDNQLQEVPSTALRKLNKIKLLDIVDNKFNEIKKDAFKGMTSLRNVMLSNRDAKQRIIKIDYRAFRFLRSLKVLNLNFPGLTLRRFPELNGTSHLREVHLRRITNLTIPSTFCQKQLNLSKIVIETSTMESFPILSKCRNLREMDFLSNKIQSIPEHAFSGLIYLQVIDLLQKNNMIGAGQIHPNAFSNLPSLIELDFSHYQLRVFPNLTGTHNLKYLHLPHCGIKHIPRDFCQHAPNLLQLDLSFNNIKDIPSLSKCKQLETINLMENRIDSIDQQLTGLNHLEVLMLKDNYITKITKNTLSSLFRLKTLVLRQNLISNIDIDAFKYIKNLERLDVSFNKISSLPTNGIQSVLEIKVTGNKELIKFPSQEELPHARQLDLVYPYHCCFFMKSIQQISDNDIELQFLSSHSNWTTLSNSIIPDEIPLYLNEEKSSRSNKDMLENYMEPLLRRLNNDTDIYFEKPTNMADNKHPIRSSSSNMKEVYCSPTPNEFYPCEDLMGEEWLRVCVWMVFLSALFGNIVVFVVLAINVGRKADVPKYLVMNLAFADLCLAVYLGFLAFVDIVTLGDFRLHALEWQFSTSCNAAGFLAIFASELSVYTLTVLTVERFTTIKHSMRIDKKITKKQAAIIMFIGWVLSAILASLPLLSIDEVKFSDYTKYSVCLPFDIESATSKAYVSILLILNMSAFLVILVCYVKIYLFIRGSNAWNSGDSKVARRMAILVFTDFACWFPISIIALFAVYGNSLVEDLWISKVLTIFVFPLNACANPFLYAIFTKTFRKDVLHLLKRVKQKSNRSRDLSKSLLKLPVKSSLTYSTSVRRESSCSFLFNRRASSRADDIKCQVKQQCDTEDRNDESHIDESQVECRDQVEERLTSL